MDVLSAQRYKTDAKELEDQFEIEMILTYSPNREIVRKCFDKITATSDVPPCDDANIHSYTASYMLTSSIQSKVKTAALSRLVRE